MALNGFSVLLFVPAAPKVLAETKKTISTTFCRLNLRLKLSQNAIENKVYYDVAITLCYFSDKEKIRIDRPEVICVVKGERGRPPMPPMIKRMLTKPILYKISGFF